MPLTAIEKKSLKHTFELLHSIRNYEVYSELKSELRSAGISEENISSIMDKYDAISLRHYNPISEAKDWIKSVLDSNEK